MYLLDTNIILEYLLDQEKSGDVEQFFLEMSADQLYLSEFSLYSWYHLWEAWERGSISCIC